MSRSTANHQTVIYCDSPTCPTQDRARFVTYSIAMMARSQARNVGWQRLPAWTITTEDSPRRIYDICPLEAPVALERKAKRPEILLAERAARKTVRAEMLASREIARIEKRDQRARRKAEKIAESEHRAAERAGRKAEKIAESEDRAGHFSQKAASTTLTVAVERTLPSPRVTKSRNPILAVIERMLLAHGQAMTVAEIVGHAIGELVLPTTSKTPRTIIARDLAIDIKKHGVSSRFTRVAPGTFALRGVGAQS